MGGGHYDGNFGVSKSLLQLGNGFCGVHLTERRCSGCTHVGLRILQCVFGNLTCSSIAVKQSQRTDAVGSVDGSLRHSSVLKHVPGFVLGCFNVVGLLREDDTGSSRQHESGE